MDKHGDTEFKSISLPRLNNLKPNEEVNCKYDKCVSYIWKS